MEIRPYRPTELARLCEICLRTGDAGQDGTTTMSDRALVGLYYAAPYPAFSSKCCLMLGEPNQPAVGYIVGTHDTRAYLHWFNREWLPPIRAAYRARTARAGAGDGWLFEVLQQDATPPSWVDDYPAHLHIDLLPEAQGRGLGRKLAETWIQAAAEAGAPGLHLGVAKANLRAIQFYERLGLTRQADAGGAWMYVMNLRSR